MHEDRPQAPPGYAKPIKVTFASIDTHVYKDVLASWIKKPADDPGYWGLHREVGADYKRQLASEHKILEGKGATTRFVWKPRYVGAPNHYWDIEVYLAAAATYHNAGSLLSVKDLQAQQQLMNQYRQTSTQPPPRRKRW